MRFFNRRTTSGSIDEAFYGISRWNRWSLGHGNPIARMESNGFPAYHRFRPLRSWRVSIHLHLFDTIRRQLLFKPDSTKRQDGFSSIYSLLCNFDSFSTLDLGILDGRLDLYIETILLARIYCLTMNYHRWNRSCEICELCHSPHACFPDQEEIYWNKLMHRYLHTRLSTIPL